MKKLILILLVSFLPFNAYAQPVVWVAPNTTLTSGYRDVAVAGTAIALSGSVVIFKVIVKASLANSGDIYIGGSDVDTTSGVVLDAGEVWVGTVNNLNKIYVNATTSGDSVGFTYETQ